MAKSDLRIDWATHKAAKYACENWHYSGCLSAGKIVKLGVWEDGEFRGVVLFSRGATPAIGSPYSLKQTEVCELTRVALREHVAPVSRIVSICLRFLSRASPGIRLVVSFADAAKGHHGGIYQAGGWVYSGGSKTHAYHVRGIVEHPKSLHGRYGRGGQSIPWLHAHVDPHAERIVAGVKHKYLMPLDDEMRRQIAPLAQPYPKRDKQAMIGATRNSGGATPTVTLQTA